MSKEKTSGKNLKKYHFNILDIDPNSTVDDVRNAYKKKALKYHPDKNINNPNTQHMFQLIQKAYEILSKDDDKYDSDLDEDDLKLFKNGTKLSNEYQIKIKQWIQEYRNNLNLTDNFTDAMLSITNEILNKFNHLEQQSKIYNECNICNQMFLDMDEHKLTIVTGYTSLFENPYILKLDILLKNRITNEIWNWKQLTPKYTRLLCDPEWYQIFNYIEQIVEPVEIISSSSVYNLYLNTTSDQYKMIETLVHNLTTANLIIYTPDDKIIQQLKNTFDHKYTTTYGKYRLPSQTKINMFNNKNNVLLLEKYFNINNLFYIVQHEPNVIRVETQYNCNICSANFNIFLRKSHCIMCGTLQCHDCQVVETVPHLGYTYPVKICKKCVIKRNRIDVKILMDYINNLIKNKNFVHIDICLALIHSYINNENNDFFQTIGKQLYSFEQFQLALQAFNYSNLDENEWLRMALDACSRNDYSTVLTCVKILKKDKKFWLEKGNEYEQMSNETSTINVYSILCLLCYKQAELTDEEILEKCLEYDKLDKCELCLFYLLYLNETGKVDWKEKGEIYLSSQNRLATFCFKQAQLSIDGWINVLTKLCENHEYNRVAFMLISLDKSIQHKLSIKFIENNILYYLIKILLNQSINDWLNHAVSLKNKSKIIWCMAFINVKFKIDSWSKLKTLTQYDQFLLCSKMEQLYNNDDEMIFDEQLLHNHDQLTFEIRNLSVDTDWKLLGDKYFNENEYHLALKYYLQLNDNDDILRYVLSKAQCLWNNNDDYNTAMLYIIAVYKYTRQNYKLLATVIHNSCKLLLEHNEDIIDILISTIKVYENIPDKSSHLYKLHLLLINELGRDEQITSLQLVNGGCHIIDNRFSEHPINELNELIKNTNEMLNRYLEQDVKEAIEQKSINKLVLLFDKMNNPKLLRTIVDTIDVSTNIERAMVYLIKAQISKLENNSLETVANLEQALLCCSNDNTLVNTIVSLIEQVSVQHILLNDIKNLNSNLNNNVDFIDQLVTSSIISNTDLPTALYYSKSLKHMNLIRKYEKSIFKGSSNKSVAFRYLDMCSISNSPTCIAANCIMAALHFYQRIQSIHSMNTIAEIYAYRNGIFDLCNNIHILAKYYLSPHMQIYFYKLSFTLIVKTNQILKHYLPKKHSSSTQLLIQKNESQFITNLLENIINTSTLSPLIQMPTSLTYDTMYLHMAGKKVLTKFLKQIKTNYSQYLLFEGVCKGWIDDSDNDHDNINNFDTIRYDCMNSLLREHQWTMNDVQTVLEWSYIHRTTDGWLLNNVKSLNTHENYKFSNVVGVRFNVEMGEIKLLFQTSKTMNDALLGIDDVVEILTHGITSAIFALEPIESFEYPLHPFQELKYAPQSLTHTNYLKTLLHSYSLIQMMLMGTEVCATSPFPMKNIYDGFMQQLPTRLQEKLQPIYSAENVWLESDELTYEKHDDGNIISYYINDFRMLIKVDGKILDTLTDSYNDLGTYFPAILRLKELLKLGALLTFIRASYIAFEKISTNIQIDDQTIEEYLAYIKRVITYPRATTSKVSEEVDEILRENNRSRWDVSLSNINDLESSIRSDLIDLDEKQLSIVVDVICISFHCEKNSTVKNHIEKWLDYDWHKDALLKFLMESAKEYRQQKYSKLLNVIKTTGINLNASDRNLKLANTKDECSWIPRIFLKNAQKSVIYGGISLQQKLVRESPKSQTRSSIAFDLAELFKIAKTKVISI